MQTILGLLAASLLIISCGNNSNNSKGGDSSILATDDPCSLKGKCTDLREITSSDVYATRVASYGSSKHRNYFIGRTYEYSRVELVNHYDRTKDMFLGNCLISYTEKETLFKVDEDYVNQYSTEPHDRQVYKLDRSDYVLITNTEDCKEYMQEHGMLYGAMQGFKDQGLYFDNNPRTSAQDRANFVKFLEKYKIIILKYNGRPAIRIESRGWVDSITGVGWYSPDGNGDKKIAIKTQSVMMQYQDDSFASDIYNKSISKLKNGTIIEQNSSGLIREYDSEIDLSEIPERYQR